MESKYYCGCGCCLFLVGILIFSISWQTIPPTQYGLLYNKWTGRVWKFGVYEGGRHLVGPQFKFIEFPATAVMLSFSKKYGATAPPIQARTGGQNSKHISGQSSGGQPVAISASFLYKIPKDFIPSLYKQYATSYNSRFIQYSQQILSNVAQEYKPSDFWENRAGVALAMQKALAKQLKQLAGVNVVMFQILYLEFAQKYENNIISIQLAVQNKMSKEYQLKVVQVSKQIDILNSQKSATVNVITATAQANAQVIRNTASAKGFNVTQTAKVSAYGILKDGLDLARNELLKYIDIKMLSRHSQQKLTVGIARPHS